MSHGLRKVNEYLVQNGRTIVLTQELPVGITHEQWDNIADGTIYIQPSNGDISYKRTNADIKSWSKFLPENLFKEESLAGNILINETINEPKYKTGSISSRAIANRGIVSEKIGLGQIKTEHFLENSLDGKVISINTLNGSALKDNSVSNSKISDNIDGAKLLSSSITEKQLGTSCVNNRALQNNAITHDKLTPNCVESDNISSNAVTTIKLALNSVTSDIIAPNSIDSKHIHSIPGEKIDDASISRSKLENLCINKDKIADSSIVNSKIADNAVTTAKLAKNSVTIDLLDPKLTSFVENAVVHTTEGGAKYADVNGNLRTKGNISNTGSANASITGYKVYNAVFADYAEGFVAAEPVEPGDIVEIDKHGCIKKAGPRSRKLVGVVSDRYAICLDASAQELESGAKVPVGLLGKVPISVSGTVEPGDMIISSGDGIGIVSSTYCPGTVIGQALESKEFYGIGKVLCLIRLM